MTRNTYWNMKTSAQRNYTTVKAVVSRSRTSLDEVTDRVWSFTQDVGTQVADWWSSLDLDDMRDNIQSNTRGQF
jgi:hypothetical protein